MAIDVGRSDPYNLSCPRDIARSLRTNLSRRSGQTGQLMRMLRSPSNHELYFRRCGQLRMLRFVFCFFVPSLLDVYTAQNMHFVLYSLRDTCLDRRPLRDIMCGMCPSQRFMAVYFLWTACLPTKLFLNIFTPAPRRDVISSWLGMSMEGGGEK